MLPYDINRGLSAEQVFRPTCTAAVFPVSNVGLVFSNARHPILIDRMRALEEAGDFEPHILSTKLRMLYVFVHLSRQETGQLNQGCWFC